MPQDHAFRWSRRRTLERIAALSAAGMLVRPAAGQSPTVLVATPAQTEGPFYPRSLPADRDGDLTQISGRGKPSLGTVLYLTGVVRRTDGKPLSGAVVELWQCDAMGVYHHVGESRAPDENFQGYGTVTADSQGRYAFKTMRPVPYTGRMPHLHVKLRHAEVVPLTTQLYVAGDSTAGDGVVRYSGSDTHQRLSMQVTPVTGKETGALAASYDFVLRMR